MIKRFFLFPAFLLNATIVAAQEAAEHQSVKVVAAERIDTAKDLLHMVLEFVVKYSFQAVGGVIVLILGWILSKYLAGFVNKVLSKKHLDITIAKFLVSTVKLIIMTFAVIVALGKFGIEVAPLIAGISVAGFGLSFALQGPLSNYAAGAVLIFTKPFKVTDIIEVAGVVGEVVDMQLSRTLLKTVDGHSIFVPNKHIVGEIIHNYSALKRLDLTVGISYKSDVEKAVRILSNIIKNESKIYQDKEYKAGISEFADSSINLMARVRCKQDDYWHVMFAVNKKIYEEFKNQGIDIPFPQRDVYIHKDL